MLVSLGLVPDDPVCKQQWVQRLKLLLLVLAIATLAFFLI